jgi:carboxypeptidase Taq
VAIVDTKSKQLYSQLFDHLEKARSIEAAIQLCEWDQETYMPEEGIFFRSLTVSNLSEIHHKLKTSLAYKKLLGSLIDLKTGEIIHSDLSLKEISNLKILKEDFDKNTKIPAKFVSDFSKLTSEATFAWQKAKEHSDFKSFAPYLKKIVQANQKKAKLLGFTHHPYDALIDLYEPGMTVQILDELFTKLKFFLIDLLKKIKASGKKIHDIDKRSSFHHQMHFGRELLDKLGLKKEFSRLDITVHPFCSSIGPKDIRLTTRIIEDDFISNIYSCLHEGGHGLYAYGLSKFAPGLPEGQSASLGLDESQSRLYETRLGKSYGFIEAMFPLLKQELKTPHLRLEDLYASINKVEPHFIRIESDEVSYCLHIILRYEIEKGLIEGSIKVDDVNKIWNAKMEEYLGIIPAHDSQGCLQDIHWSMGSIGYFPTYALGNIYAASLFESFMKKNQTFEMDLQTMDLSSLQTYLQHELYDHGRLLKPVEIITKATGTGLNPEPYIRYLSEKFSKLYDLN